jgi:hypothetical protein
MVLQRCRAYGAGFATDRPANPGTQIFKLTANVARSKAAVNAPQCRRFAQFEGVRQSRSVWTARVFSTAFPADFVLVLVIVFWAGFEDDPASVF